MSATALCIITNVFKGIMNVICQSQCPCGLRRRSAVSRAAEIMGSNPTGDMDVCLLWVLCVVRCLRRAHHSSRKVVRTVLRRCV